MRKMRIALGSNDGKNILSGHMGEAKDFYLYDVFENGEIQFIEKRENTSPQEGGKHGLNEKRNAVMELLPDAEVFIGNKMSPNFVKIACNTKCQPVVVKINVISDAISALAKSFDKIYTLVEQRKHGNFFREIPKINPS